MDKRVVEVDDQQQKIRKKIKRNKASKSTELNSLVFHVIRKA